MGPPALGGAGAGRRRPRHRTRRPRSCRGSWGNKPLETPSVGGSGDIVWDPISLHPFPALAAAFPALPSSSSQPPPRRLNRGALRPAVQSTARHGTPGSTNSPQTFGTDLPLARRASWQTGRHVKRHVPPRSPPQPPASSGGELPSRAPRLISERFPGRPQPDFPEVVQSALNGSGFNVGGRWAPHKGPSPLQAGLSPCLIKS